MKDVMRFWMSMGCDGFRVDMAGSLVKNDDDQEGTIALWQDFRKFMDEEFPECALLSEWGDPGRSLKGGFHMDFLLHFGPSSLPGSVPCKRTLFFKKRKGRYF
ncbi:MAG: alpha-amylase family glycosyl hydrolase [Blautia wexlerae]